MNGILDIAPSAHRSAGNAAVSLALLCGLAACTSAPPSAPTLAQGAAVSSPAGDYELVLPSDSWQQVEPESTAEDPRDLQLVLGDEVLVVARRRANAGLDLDPIVDLRRSQTLADGVQYSERRYLLPSDSSSPASLARYSGGGFVLLALTSVKPPLGLEVTALLGNGSGQEREAVELLQSLRFREPSGSVGETP